MKTILLSGCLLFIASTSWGQLKKEPNQVLQMQQYWDRMKKKNEAGLKAPMDLLKKKQAVSRQEPLNQKIILPAHGYKNVMPVVSPDSSYVYNMPGTHAFDQSKARGGIFFVTEHPIIFKDCYNQPEYVQINSLKDYFELLQTKRMMPNGSSTKK